MNRYVKISAALAAFALLLVVMGLSTQGAVNAQNPTGTITTMPKYVCSLDSCADAVTNDSIITVVGGENDDITVTNLDVARVAGVNPKDITLSNNSVTITVVQQGRSTESAEDDPGGLTDTQIRGFNGNRIQIEYEPTDSNTFATYATITVDNVQPQLVTNSPSIPLISKGSVDITFSADITDGGSGYDAKVETIAGKTDSPGILADTTNDETDLGGVRLVVAGNVVALGESNFSAIDGGWNVWATINSSAIQSIGANTPWYFETRDRAGNTRRSSGSVELKGVSVTSAQSQVTDSRFGGNLQANTFDSSSMKVTRDSNSVSLPITGFSGLTSTGEADGTFTLGASGSDPDVRNAENPFGNNAPITDGDDFELVGTNLLTVDSKAPRLAGGVTGSATTGVAYKSSPPKGDARGITGKANSIKIEFADDGKDADDNAGSNIDASTVTPAAFTVGNNSVNSALVVDNDVYLTLSDNLGPDEQPSITIASGQIKDKAGNAYGGERIAKAKDGLGPNLSLSKSGDLSKDKVTVTVTTDEQLSQLPEVDLRRVGLSDGTLVDFGALVCQSVDEEAGSPLLLGVDIGDLGATEQCGALQEPESETNTNLVGLVIADPRAPQGGEPSVSQTGALSYTFSVTPSTAPGNGGKFNVYVTGVDTQDSLNESKTGTNKGANNVGAFTFQLDSALNGGGDPVVKVGEEEAVGGEGDVPTVEAIDNLIVTVDFAGEANEYPGDSYRTVDLTLAELTVSFKDGTTEKTTFNLTTDVNSPDNVQFTLALLNPKVGNYSLKVKATDSAGNASGTAGHTSRWEVVSAKPVKIDLQPGWNMISLPFQPGNPAINSVIPSTHPADIVMTFDGPTQTWLVSRRDAESGLFVGDIAVMTASTAYFVRTTNFLALSILRPPIATNAAPPPQIPALAVVKGWNLIPIVSNASPLPDEIPADEYFGTLANAGNAGWLKAITFNTLARTWEDVTPGTPEGETPEMVKRGKGYWLYATGDGVIIP